MPHLFPPTKGEQRARALGYVCVAVAGFYIMWDTLIGSRVDADVTVYGMSDYAKVAWAAFMMSALPCACAALKGRYQIESVLLPLFGSALGLAVFWGMYRMFAHQDWDLLTRIAYAAGLMCFLVVRGLQIHRVVKGGPWESTSDDSSK